jgi:deazaflavin-dependent oxidoreductase (nitroreductase family)
MPLPRSLTRFTRTAANPIIGTFAGQLPGFALLHHVGRRTGKDYWIPVNVFMRDEGYIIGLTYGPDVDWAKNVIAAGACELRTHGRIVRLVNPSIETDSSASWAPMPARPLLRKLKVDQYMLLSPPA